MKTYDKHCISDKIYVSIQFDPAPRSENETVPKRVPDYFLWPINY